MSRITLVILALGIGPQPGEALGQTPRRLVDSPGIDAPDITTASDQVEAAKAQAAERLKGLDGAPRPSQAGDTKAAERVRALREIFKARLDLLARLESTARSLGAVEHPETTPEAEAEALKLAADRARAALSLAAHNPAGLLPDVFHAPATRASEVVLAEMKEAIAAAQEVVDDRTKGVDRLAAPESRSTASALTATKAQRDEIRGAIAALAPRAREQEAALGSAASAEDREVLRERLVNLRWEARLESLRLKEVEARIRLETRRSGLAELCAEARKVELDLARRRLDLMQRAFRQRNEQALSALKKASASEGARAEQSSDPLDRFRARRNKELLDQEALLHEKEEEKAATPTIALADQEEKANKTAEDFDRLKKLVTGGRSAGLVAQRLNNSFRRLDAERATIIRTELAPISLQLGRYENELTAVELDQINDSRGDQAMRDELQTRLPASRRAEALAFFEESEHKQHEILEKRRRVLTDLADRADRTRQQVLRRLKILDDQHHFVMTHLFWVRDSPPLGPATFGQARAEASDLVGTLLRIASEPWTWSRWQRMSPDFLWAALGLVTLPYTLYRARKALRELLERHRMGRAVGEG